MRELSEACEAVARERPCGGKGTGQNSGLTSVLENTGRGMVKRRSCRPVGHGEVEKGLGVGGGGGGRGGGSRDVVDFRSGGGAGG